MKQTVYLITEQFSDDLSRENNYNTILGVFDSRKEAEDAALVREKSLVDSIIDEDLYYEEREEEGAFSVVLPYCFSETGMCQMYEIRTTELTMNENTNIEI